MRRFLTPTVLLISLSAFVVDARADITVLATNPTSNAIEVDRSHTIRVTFDTRVDSQLLTERQFHVFGQWSGVARGGLSTSDDGRTVVFQPDRPFAAGEKVTVYVARSVSAIDGSTLGRGYAFQYWVRSAPASIRLVETGRVPVRRSGEPWLQTYGAYAADFNEDGYTDLVVPNERTNDIRLFLNDGAGGFGPFQVYPLSNGAAPSTNEAADFNRDGHVDFAVGNSQGFHVHVFMGDGRGNLTITDVPRVGAGVRGLAVLDLNGDSYPDIATASRNAGTVSLLVNDGEGNFPLTESINTPSFGETAASAADMNEDGQLDLLVGSLESGDVRVLLSDGQGGLVLHAREPAGDGVWMITTGDVNADGHADVVTANSGDNTVSVLFGDGTGGVSLAGSYPSGVIPLAIDLGDIDGDGDLDMVSSNFGGIENGSWTVFENLGNGSFTVAETHSASGAGSCAVLHDRDNDGALDMTTVDELDDLLVLFSNQLTPTSTGNSEVPGSDVALSIYPNPFRDETVIEVSGLPFDRRQGAVKVFDVTGRRVMTLPLVHRQTWLGLDAAGRPLPPGLYVVGIRANDVILARPLIRSGL